ncbi:MAG: F0F1 ATP synthase subunit B [Candidatus Dormibacteraeota bacterium]|nr:F0F1 ATP synthase subunit B [Candidatus Dormibacteraeota bacterium]
MVADAALLEINATFVVEIIAFVVMLLVLSRFAYPRIMRAAEERQRRIDESIKAAQEAQARAEKTEEDVRKSLEEARGQAREIVNRAHTDAVVEAEEVRNRARAEAEALVTRARGDIESERDRAIADLRSEMSVLVVEATARVLGEAIDARSHQRLIDDALTKVGDGAASKSGKN